MCPSCTSELGMLHVYGVILLHLLHIGLFIIDLQY